MTPAQIRTIRNSFSHMEQELPVLGRNFYDRLFAAAPSLRGLFHGDMAALEAKFTRAVGDLVQRRSAMALPALGSGMAAPAMSALERGHGDAQARPEHFGIMQTVLVTLLGEKLGEHFTDTVREAWEAASDVLARAMLDSAADLPDRGDRFFDRLHDEGASDTASAPQPGGRAGLREFFG